MKNKIIYWIPKILIILLGIFLMFFGEIDDSPGLGGIGLIIIIFTILKIIKKHKNMLK